jgi:hypothetical protein
MKYQLNDTGPIGDTRNATFLNKNFHPRCPRFESGHLLRTRRLTASPFSVLVLCATLGIAVAISYDQLSATTLFKFTIE